MSTADTDDRQSEAKRIIEAMGGTNACARFFDITPASVSEWLERGLPKARLRHLRDVRPGLFGDAAVVANLRSADGAAAAAPQ